MRRLLTFFAMLLLALPVLAQGPVFPPVSRTLQLGGDSTATTCSDREVLVADSGGLACGSTTQGISVAVSGTDSPYSIYSQNSFTGDASGGTKYGSFLAGRYSGGDTLGTLYGVAGGAYSSGGGTTTTSVGGYFFSQLVSSSTVTTAVGFRAAVLNSSSTITNAVGASIRGIALGSSTNVTDLLLGTDTPAAGSFALYSSSGRQSFFDGPVRVDDYLAIDPQATPPSTPSLGWIYVDSDLNLPCFYNGSGWVQMDDFSTACS